jgi:ABC-type phosphate/phosphonate transport system substrate-binding protein
MYDLPSTSAALDALWAGFATRLRTAGIGGVPATLTRHSPIEAVWRDRDLLVAQTCGYPLLKYLAGKVRVVATPIYDVPGCDDARHCSFVVVSAGSRHAGLGSLRGGRAAVNAPDSNTGMNLFRAVIAPLAEGGCFFAEVAITGAHAASLAAVASGRADVAAIDCVSFWLLSRERPELADRVRILARTPPSPCLPLVTSSRTGDDELAVLRETLATTAESPDLAGSLRALGIAGFRVLPDDAYAVIARYERDAAALGYPLLA